MQDMYRLLYLTFARKRLQSNNFKREVGAEKLFP